MTDLTRAGPPSVFAQASAVSVGGLVDSPRNYNASLVEWRGKRLMAYRSHRMDQGGRCGIVVAELNQALQAISNHWIELPAKTGTEHHEDPRLFIFQDSLHLCYTESRLYRDRPYTCAIKYCRLSKQGPKAWQASEIMQPRYGRNDGMHQEKNWQFFDDGGVLRCIYEAEPHTILTVEGERVVHVDKAEQGLRWPWGTVRGGTPPVKLDDGRWLTFFHSATWHPVAPHWRRYYAGAYIFEGKAPWRILEMSHEPILTGSEEDGHGFDPRHLDSWKPFVVFPCGAMRAKGGWLVSYGVNDHTTIVAEHSDLKLGRPDFKDWAPRYFLTDNASLPLQIATDERSADWVHWQPVGAVVGGSRSGVMKASNPRLAMILEELAPAVDEISVAEYRGMGGR